MEYDNEGRATVSKGPSDADKLTFAYSVTATSPITRTITNTFNKQTVYNYAGGFRLDSVVGNASANCPASTESYAYTFDFLTSITDAEGRVRRFTRNTLGQPTQIVDGFGTASARTTGITWHSTLRVPTQIVQPTLTTDFNWSTSGQLNSVTQTDTTTQTVPYSTNGQTRVWAYTYDSFGRLLTVDGPLSGSGDTVTFTYDSSGFLATVTNEVGHVLTVTAVDPRGLPTSVVDENGVLIDLTYNSERRLIAVKIDPNGAAALTSIEYDVVGLIARIVRPNGAFLRYTWNSAKRLTKIEDNEGSFIEYDYNLFGNVTARRIKNSGGTTLLSQTSTFDELGGF